MKSFKEYKEKVQELSDLPKKPTEKDDHWGYHLLVDMSGCNSNIDKEKEVRSFIKELVKELDMEPVGDPILKRLTNDRGEGISAIQLITTSTISFHSDNENKCIYIDVFSCKKYDPKTAFVVIKKYFEPTNLGYKWIYRDAGKWPKKFK